MLKRAKKEKVLVSVEAGTADCWREVAAKLGIFSLNGGKYAGQGNFSGLLDALIAGKVDLQDFENARRRCVLGAKPCA